MINPVQTITELDTAAWDLAEAERHERIARKLRMQAIRRSGAVAADLRAAWTEAVKARTKKNQKL